MAVLAIAVRNCYTYAMADEPENLTLRVLQEIRDEMRDMRADLSARLEALAEDVTDLTQRVDGNTLTFSLVAGVTYDHEQRIALLEQRSHHRS